MNHWGTALGLLPSLLSAEGGQVQERVGEVDSSDNLDLSHCSRDTTSGNAIQASLTAAATARGPLE